MTRRSALRRVLGALSTPLPTIRARRATRAEAIAAGLPARTGAKTITVSLCSGDVRLTAVERPLAGDVTEAARTYARLFGRPEREALAAAWADYRDRAANERTA